MEIETIEDKKKRFVFYLKGVDHAFCNFLKDSLRENDDVTIAAYNIDHPLVGIPKIIIETKNKTPREALNEALKKMKAHNSKLRTGIKKKIK